MGVDPGVGVRSDAERAVVAKVDVKGLVEQVLQVGGSQAGDLGEQQIEILGGPRRETQAQFEAGEASKKTGNFFFMPSGLQPPRM